MAPNHHSHTRKLFQTPFFILNFDRNLWLIYHICYFIGNHKLFPNWCTAKINKVKRSQHKDLPQHHYLFSLLILYIQSKTKYMFFKRLKLYSTVKLCVSS